MTDLPESEMPLPSRALVAKATSELNNLLQVISGTSAALELFVKGNDTAQEHFDVLRASVARAEQVAVDLAFQAGGSAEKIRLQPHIAPFARVKRTVQPPLVRQTILIVDDEEMTLQVIERFLLEAGFEVVRAASAFDCLDLVRIHPHRFAMVLLDLSLPFMDGEETFRRIREIRSDLPVVLCTGFIEQEKLAEMMRSGLSGFLRKPIAPDEIARVVRSTLESAKYEHIGLSAS